MSLAAFSVTLPLDRLFEMKGPGDYTVLASLPVVGDVDAVLTAGPKEAWQAIFEILWDVFSAPLSPERVEREIRAMQSLATRNDRWTPPIVKTVATDGVGIKELAEAIADYEAYLKKENLVFKKNVENWRERLVEMLRDAMLEKAREQMEGEGGVVERYASEIAEHKRDPYSLVEEIARGLELHQERPFASRISGLRRRFGQRGGG